VISMEMMGKIRRMYFRDKLSLHQIAKRTGLSRNTIRKWVRAPEATQPAYLRTCGAQPPTNSVRFTIWSAVSAMRTTYSKSQARRRMRRLLVLVAQGQTFVITQNGKAACLLVQV